jgi:hypothetical protein
VRAAVDGVVDFSQLDLHDPNWHRRLRLIVDEMLRQDRLKSLELLHRRKLAFLQVCTEPVARGQLIESEAQMVDDYLNVMNGQPASQVNSKIRVAKKLRDSWAIAFGDPKDAKVQASIDATAEMLRQQREATTPRRPKK